MARNTSEARSPSRKRGRSLSREPSLGPPPVVVFNSSGGRAFRRVLKEESFNDFKRSIRAKLRLPEGVRLYLAETRDGRRIDLDDDDDFEAFQAAAELDAQLEVEVEVDDTDAGPPKGALTDEAPKRRKPTKSKKKHTAGSLQQAPESYSQTELVAEASRDGSPPRGRVFHRRALDGDKPGEKHKGKGSKSKVRASSPAPPLSQTVEEIELPPRKKKERSAKRMSPNSTDVPASEPATKRKRKRTEPIPATNAEDEASRAAVATPEKAKKRRRAPTPFEPVVAAQEGDTAEHNGARERKNKKKRGTGANDDSGAPLAENAIASVSNDSLGVPPSKKRKVSATLSARDLPPKALSPMTRQVNELLDLVYKNNPGLAGGATWKHQHADSSPSSPPPTSSEIQRDVRASTRDAPQNSDVTADTGRPQDVTIEEERKSRKKKKSKGASENQARRKKKERQPQDEYGGGNESSADTRTDQVERNSGINPPSSPQCREKPGDILPAAPRSSTAIHTGPLDRVSTRSRNAIGSPPPPISPPTPKIAILELESLLKPSKAEKRKARTALFNEENVSAKDLDGDASQDSESVRSSTPSEARRGRKRVRATTARARPGFRPGSEDDVSDSPESVPNVPQTFVPQVGPERKQVNPLPKTASGIPGNGPPAQSRDDPRLASEDATPTAAEGDETSLDGSMPGQSAVIGGGRQLWRVTDGVRNLNGVIDGAENASDNYVVEHLNGLTGPRRALLANTLSSRRKGPGLNRQEVGIESIDEFCTQQDPTHFPDEGGLSMPDRSPAPDSPIQPSSPWTPNGGKRSALFVDTPVSQIANHRQSSAHHSSPLPPYPRSPPSLQFQMMKHHETQAGATSTRPSGTPVSVIVNPGSPRRSMDSLTGRVESGGLKGSVFPLGTSEKHRDAPARIASERLTRSGTASQKDPTPVSKPAFEGDHKPAQANGRPTSAAESANGPRRGDSVGSAGTSTPGPVVEERLKWAATYLRNSGMTKMVLRDFFTHEGALLGKMVDTKEKLCLQAIELMKTHPTYYNKLKHRFDNAVKTNKAQLQELPPPMIPPSPSGAKSARTTSADSSRDANVVDCSLLEQPTDTPRALSGSESEPEPEVRPNSFPANATGGGPRASMPVPMRFSRSQPACQSRPSAPIMSLKNMTQDYVRSAVKSTAKTYAGRARSNRPSNGKTQQQESDQDDEEDSDDSNDAPRPSQIPADRRAGAGLVSSAFKSLRNSMFLSQ